MRRLALAGLLAAALAGAPAGAAELSGAWLFQSWAAVGLYPCGAAICGRIVWLNFKKPPGQRFDHDKLNPDPALRTRPLCGLTVLTRLRPAGVDRWRGGVFYNPRDGHTYRVNVEFAGPATLKARFYVVAPLLGKTQVLQRFDLASAPVMCPGVQALS